MGYGSNGLGSRGPNPMLFMDLIGYLLFMECISNNRPMRDTPKIGQHETNKDFVTIYRGHLGSHKGTILQTLTLQQTLKSITYSHAGG